MNRYFTYILASERNGTLYIGVTWNPIRRTQEHKAGTVEGFTQKYNVDMLVWYETFSDIYDAIVTEKRLKKWKREWKLNLIESNNPEWRDLYDDVIQ